MGQAISSIGFGRDLDPGVSRRCGTRVRTLSKAWRSLEDAAYAVPLSDYLRKQDDISQERIYKLLYEIASGLSDLHSLGIVHRDLKPANIFLDEDGTAVIGDIGEAKICAGTHASGTVAGTEDYMAPETHFRNVTTTAADVFALGVLMLQAVTRHEPCPGPWTDEDMVVIPETRRRAQDIAAARTKCLELSTVACKCLEQRPSDRPGAGAVAAKLSRFLAALQVGIWTEELQHMRNSLNWAWTDLDSKKAIALAAALKRNSTLQILNLYSNFIGDEGAIALAATVKQNTTLKVLVLGGNKIGDQGAHAIANALKQNRTMNKLASENNNIGDDAKKGVRDAWGKREGRLWV